MIDSYIVSTYSNVSCLHPVMFGIKEILFEWMSLKQKKYTHCKFRIFCKNLFSRKAFKDTFAMLKLATRHALPISVNDRVILPFREGLIFTKLCVPKVLRK